MTEKLTLLDVLNLHQEMQTDSALSSAAVQELILMAHKAGRLVATAELNTKIEELEYDIRCHTHDWE